MIVFSMSESDYILLNALDFILRVLHNDLMVFVLDISRVLHHIVYLPLRAKEQLIILVLFVCLVFVDLGL